MTHAPTTDALGRLLFSQQEDRIFAVLGGASVPNLPHVLWEQKPDRVCLVKGELSPEEAAVAPWLVTLERESHFTDWVLRAGWGRHWGIFAVGPPEVDLRAARDHFREFLMVRLPDGRVVRFRYYDPRVFRVYLPTCNEAEAAFVFGPFESFFIEDEDPGTALQFRPGGDGVRIERTDLGEG